MKALQISLVSAGLFCAVNPTHAASPTAAKKPNLVFIFSDQQSWDMLGCYGNQQIITPSIDALAAEGVRFNYCISSNPVSCPTRAMLMTGTHTLTNGVMINDIRPYIGNAVTFAQALRQEGYHTGYVGKWHLYGGYRNRGIPRGEARLGFEEFYSNNCTLNFMPEQAFYFDDQGNKVKFHDWEAYGQARQAVDFIARNGDKPFALFVSFHPPHDQGAARAALRYRTITELMSRYDPTKITLRESTQEYPGESTFEDIRADYHGYYAMCTGLDIACKQIFDQLKNMGLDENTLVVYTSDHGDLLKAHGRPWAKSFPEDESVRVPLIMKFPQKLQSRVSDLLVGTLDIMPTILSLLDIPVPTTCEGTDLSQAILTADDDAVESVPLFYFFPDWRGVFTKDYTYAFDLFLEQNKESWNVLYDRKKDPKQMHNKFYDPQYDSIRERLHQLTFEWMDRFGDPLYDSHKIMALCGIENLQLDRKSEDENAGVLKCSPREAIQKNHIPIYRPSIPEDEAQRKEMFTRYNKRIEIRKRQIEAEKMKIQ